MTDSVGPRLFEQIIDRHTKLATEEWLGALQQELAERQSQLFFLNCFDALLHDSITLQIRMNTAALRFTSADDNRTSKVLNSVVSLIPAALGLYICSLA